MGMVRIPDRAGVILGYRAWRVIPGKWQAPSESLHAQSWFRIWSLAGPTIAYCTQRFRRDEDGRVGKRLPCEDAPGFGCTCGLLARYEPIEEAHFLPYLVGSVLAWGRVVHHEDRSFFRAEKGLPVAFVRPRGGTGAFPELAEEKFFRVAEALGARVVEDPEELREYSEEEASRW